MNCILGMEEVAYNSGSNKAKVQSVLLLTDGQANQGVSSKEGILAEMKKLQDAKKVYLEKMWHAAIR